MTKLVTAASGGTITPGSDAFAIALDEARPTLDLLHALREPFAWCDKNRTREGNLIVDHLDTRKASWGKNLATARFLYDLIPDQNEVLDLAQERFHIAEQVPTTEANLHRVIGRMLNQMPNTKGISDDYRLGLVDSLMYDPEVSGGNRSGGFSMPVYVRVVREVRRSCEFAPSQAKFIQLCQKHRTIFRDRQRDVLCLSNLRDDAQSILINLGDLKVPVDEDQPF